MHQQLVFLLQHLLNILAEKRLLLFGEILDLCESLLEHLLFMQVYERTINRVIVDKTELVFLERERKGALKMQCIFPHDLLFGHFLISFSFDLALLRVAKSRENQNSISQELSAKHLGEEF